jgi:hypothetical protein
VVVVAQEVVVAVAVEVATRLLLTADQEGLRQLNLSASYAEEAKW